MLLLINAINYENDMTIFLETKRLIIKAPELKDIDKVYMLDSDPDVLLPGWGYLLHSFLKHYFGLT